MARGRPKTRAHVEDKMLSKIDRKREFEAFQEALPKELRQDILEGKTSKEITKKYANYVAARLVGIALQDQNPSRALSAIKEVLDRVEGKPTETKKISHQLEDLPDDELDAVILAQFEEVASEGDD